MTPLLAILGIDPGLSGALAVVSPTTDGRQIRLIEVIDVPITGEDAQREVDASVLTFVQKHRLKAAYIERAQAMPDQGASSGFIYGKVCGALSLAVRGCLVPLVRVESQHWKRANGLPPSGGDAVNVVKERSRQRALQIFPEGASAFARSMDHNRAEAALIAWYGARLILGLPLRHGRE